MDISGLDPAAAKEYTAAVLTTLKQTISKRNELLKEFEKWKTREKLAEQTGHPDLQKEADLRKEKLIEDLQHMLKEEKELRLELDIVKGQLKQILNRPQFTIDAEMLLSQLEMVVGEKDELAEQFKDAAAADELERLKKEMGL